MGEGEGKGLGGERGRERGEKEREEWMIYNMGMEWGFGEGISKTGRETY